MFSSSLSPNSRQRLCSHANDRGILFYKLLFDLYGWGSWTFKGISREILVPRIPRIVDNNTLAAPLIVVEITICVFQFYSSLMYHVGPWLTGTAAAVCIRCQQSNGSTFAKYSLNYQDIKCSLDIHDIKAHT